MQVKFEFVTYDDNEDTFEIDENIYSYELNDEQVSVIGEIVEPKTDKIKIDKIKKKPNLVISFKRSFNRGTFRISPPKPTSPKTIIFGLMF